MFREEVLLESSKAFKAKDMAERAKVVLDETVQHAVQLVQIAVKEVGSGQFNMTAPTIICKCRDNVLNTLKALNGACEESDKAFQRVNVLQQSLHAKMKEAQKKEEGETMNFEIETLRTAIVASKEASDNLKTVHHEAFKAIEETKEMIESLDTLVEKSLEEKDKTKKQFKSSQDKRKDKIPCLQEENEKMDTLKRTGQFDTPSKSIKLKYSFLLPPKLDSSLQESVKRVCGTSYYINQNTVDASGVIYGDHLSPRTNSLPDGLQKNPWRAHRSRYHTLRSSSSLNNNKEDFLTSYTYMKPKTADLVKTIQRKSHEIDRFIEVSEERTRNSLKRLEETSNTIKFREFERHQMQEMKNDQKAVLRYTRFSCFNDRHRKGRNEYTEKSQLVCDFLNRQNATVNLISKIRKNQPYKSIRRYREREKFLS
eukprot:g5621.t1